MKKLAISLVVMAMAIVVPHALSQSQPQGTTMSSEFHLSKVGYIMMVVQDLSRAAAFYRDTLGLKQTMQSDDVLFFDAGSVTIVLRTGAAQDKSATEVVFSVVSVSSAYEALKQRGIVFQGKPHLVSGTSWAANFQDPDEHILSLFGEK